MGMVVSKTPAGYQLVEATFSHDAGPVSPGFCSLDRLAGWLSRDDGMGRDTTAFSLALAAVRRGWMPSLPGRIEQGEAR